MFIRSTIRIFTLVVLLGIGKPTIAVGLFSTSNTWSALAGIVDSLRALGFLHPFSTPTSAMAPTISSGDHIIMEGVTFLNRKPRRNDIVVFRTDGIDSLPGGNFYVKRVVGTPGDRLRIEDGKLFVNETPIEFRNAAEEIHYTFLPGARYLGSDTEEVIVTPDHYFVLGDNSPISADSRIWGFVPTRNIVGRALYCYWPAERMGRIK